MDPKDMTQEQRQALFEQAGHTGIAPLGYGGEGGSSGGGSGVFNFDYVQAAKDAYGELGVYYDRILKESKGDLNLALSRLTSDYDKGVRIRTENTNTANTADTQANQNNALRRGLYTKSNFDPNGGFGLGDVSNPDNPYGKRIAANDLALTRNNETAATALERTTTDKTTAEQRNEFKLEQQRRTEAANLADTRGNRALQDWQQEQVVLA